MSLENHNQLRDDFKIYRSDDRENELGAESMTSHVTWLLYNHHFEPTVLVVASEDRLPGKQPQTKQDVVVRDLFMASNSQIILLWILAWWPKQNEEAIKLGSNTTATVPFVAYEHKFILTNESRSPSNRFESNLSEHFCN